MFTDVRIPFGRRRIQIGPERELVNDSDARRFNEHNWRARLLASGLEPFNSPGVHSGEDKWGESYPQSGPNEKSAGDAHTLSGKIEQNKSPQSPLKC